MKRTGHDATDSGDQQEPLRRHEGAHPAYEPEGAGKRAE
jgi:hypothetical protein